MMEKIRDKILKDAKKQQQKLLGEAKAQKQEKVDAAKEDIRKEAAKVLARGKEEARMEKQRLVSVANLDVKKGLLNAKEELIDAVLLKAGEKLDKHSKEAGYKATLKRLADQSEKEIGKDATIYVRKQDVRHVRGAKSRDMGPGVIAVSKDESLYLDNTFSMRLSRAETEIRKDLGAVLFK